MEPTFLSHQIAVVTGGASGIGRATSELLAACGATVVIVDINREAGEKLAAKIGEGAHFVECDMADREAVTAAYNDIISRHKAVDILVNNIGVFGTGGDILTMSDDDMETMDRVNMLGSRHLTRLVMRGMKVRDRGGCVTFVSSTQAMMVDGAPTIYNVHKTTLVGLAMTFAVAGGPYGIRVNAVLPGAIATEGMGVAPSVGRKRIEAIKHKTPLGRRGHPEEVAWEIVALCGATYTTGDIRTVDGGFSKVALPVDLAASLPQRANDPDADFLAREA